MQGLRSFTLSLRTTLRPAKGRLSPQSAIRPLWVPLEAPEDMGTGPQPLTNTHTEDPMLNKWTFQNRTAMRVATSVSGITAMALVLAAPGKWI